MTQDLPMGLPNEVVRKNYYVNIGANQGVKEDSVLDVFRIISVLNPYDNKQRVNYKVKIGELKVINVTENASITHMGKLESNTPIFDLSYFMIGDHVAINLN
jgi:hypothetical protein